MKVVTVKFEEEGVQGERMGIKSVFLLVGWFFCDEQKNHQEGIFFNLGCSLLDERLAVVDVSAGRRRARL